MSDLQELYQAVILDHNRAPRNYGALEGATRDPLVRHREGRGRAEEWRVCA